MSNENVDPIEAVDEQNDQVDNQIAQTGKDAVQNVAQNAGKKITKKLAQSAKAGAFKHSLMLALSKFLIIAFIVIVIIIIVTGIFMFLVTMPGMVMNNLKNLFKEAGKFLAAFFGADTTQMIDSEQIYETLDYLEDMGWDLKGEGFLTHYLETAEDVNSYHAVTDDIKEGIKNNAKYYIDDLHGVVRSNEDRTIVLAESDFIFTYIMSDNYIYTIKNKNLVTDSGYDGILGAILDYYTSILTAVYKFYNAIYGPLFDLFGLNNAAVDAFGKGMLVFYVEDGVGKQSGTWDAGSLWDTRSVEVDVDAELMRLKKSGIFNHNNEIVYSMDGWTGRYGMPLEFLLSVHKATLKPDLAYDMVTSFNTNVHIYMNDLGGRVESAYMGENGLVTYDEIEAVVHAFETENWWTAWLNWFDDLSTDAAETLAMRDLGIDVAKDCPKCDEESLYYVEISGVRKPLKREVQDDGTVKFFYTKKGGFLWLAEKKGAEYTGDQSLIQRTDAVCQDCMDKADTILAYLDGSMDYNFKGIQPYIAAVTDHWYRNVYYIDPNEVPYPTDHSHKDASFVQSDFDYEAVMKERWTLYETYGESDDLAKSFKWYIIDKDGNYLTGDIEDVKAARVKTEEVKEIEESKVKKGTDDHLYYYVATVDEAEEVGLAVSKKALTVDASDTNYLKDIGWVKDDSTGVWSAYKQNNGDTSTGFKPLASMYETMTDFEKEYTNLDVAQKVYINLITTGNINQVGEGQRGQTNPEIKKMFLQNKYFQYDGSTETAELIEILREKIYEDRKKEKIFDNNAAITKYGPLSEDEYTRYYNLDIDEDGELDKDSNDELIKYMIKDYSGTVSLEQDSLNAFSMLENTHTLDADYIYRDFKELVVELGYFTKEALTEEIPQLLEFLIPQIGSAGYPDRTIDKVENEWGTMIHSKYDIDTNKKYAIQQVIDTVGEIGGGTQTPEPEPEPEPKSAQLNRFSSTMTLASSRVNEGRLQLNVNPISTTEVGAVGGARKKPEQVPLKTFLKETEKMCDFINEKGYDYCVNRPSGKGGECTCTDDCIAAFPTELKCTCPCEEVHCCHSVHRNKCSLKATFEDSKLNPVKNYNFCCNFLVRWALINVGVMKVEDPYAISSMETFFIEELGGVKIEPGEPLKPGDICFYDSYAHVDIVAEKKGESSFLKFNGGHPADTGSQKGNGNSSINQFGGWNDKRPPEFAIRLNWGNQNNGIYVGYEGNEAVVSPVTGILLEYGEIERENLDQKYRPMYQAQIDKGTKAEEQMPDPDEPAAVKEPVKEKVGYARIAVLDEEYYKALEEELVSKYNVSTEPIETMDELDELLDQEPEIRGYLTETLQGYREFYEAYEYGGIAGYEIIIEGFKCELPDIKFVDTDGDESIADEVGKPKGTPLDIDKFKIKPGDALEGSDYVQTQYETEKEYQLASAKATEKLSVEELMKIDAAYSLYLERPNYDDAIFIKEGTILGRTYTDREVVEDLRNEKIEDYKSEATLEERELKEGEKNEDKIIGNYVRIMMNDGAEYEKDRTYVENVEEYMKLDEIPKAEPNDWELFFWLPFESGGADLEGHGPESQGTCSEGETAVGIVQWTVLTSPPHDGDMNNITDDFIPNCLEENPQLCAPLAAYKTWSVDQFWDDYNSGRKEFQKVLSNICDEDRDTFLAVQMEVAKKGYLEPLLKKYPWLEERPSCVQGAVMHLDVWGADTDWVGSYEFATDEEIVLKVRNVIANTDSTAKKATGNEEAGRAYNEPQIALEILKGAVTTDDIEHWVRKDDNSVFAFKFRKDG